jgi:hypothetical protein
MLVTLEDGRGLDIETTAPDYDPGWFRYRSGEALRHYENALGHRKDRREHLTNVLEGLYRHAYNKGRHDEKRAAEAQAAKGWNE